jgi:acetyl esterase/lipase
MKALFAQEELTVQDVFPLNYVRPGLPRSIVIHGASDELVDPQYALNFAVAMTAAGNQSEVRLIEDGDHFFCSLPN